MVGVVVAWYVIVEMVDIGVVNVDAETPTTIVKYNWTIEVIVGKDAVPECHAKETLNGTVALVAHSHIIVIAIAHCYIIEVIVDATDIVEIDTEKVVDEVNCCDTKGVSHTVGDETRVVAHRHIAHWLRICGHTRKGEEECCKKCTNLFHISVVFIVKL